MTLILDKATVELRASDVVLTYTPSDSLPDDGVVTLSTTFTSHDGEKIRQLGFKLIDGQLTAVYWFDHQTALNYNAASHITPGRIAGTWSIAFPNEALDGITAGTWRADLTVENYNAPSIDGAI
ncbi:hypothetical protein APR04_002546 [Promicromonospora umidemergens]|uniref:Secreted protein n=1 Tax=Promicromonospora umidemergens TaxID=629679 RepID=A0ABP8WVP8_9MICO|nr:hypothetical protein [Promicromonospora umidemergens]MCP2283638.1 hypothetical protein [Promicromonospora umidemergens]